MNPFFKKCQKSLCSGGFVGMAYDGCNFFCCNPEKMQVVKFDNCFKALQTFTTSKPYVKLCYDAKDDCFWAAAQNYNCNLYKLDKCFLEVDCLIVPALPNACICAVDFDCVCNRILVTTPNQILAICKPDYNVLVLQKNNKSTNCFATIVCDCYVIVAKSCGSACIDVCDKDFCLRSRLVAPKQYCINNIVVGARDCDKIRFYILVTCGNNSYVLQWLEDKCNFCNEPCEWDCNQGGGGGNTKSVCEILQNVALSQAALYHILNAEGEKLQKVLACTDDINKILCTNKSINNTIVKATHLEILLHDTLSVASELCRCCDKSCDKSCDCDCDCDKSCDCDCDCDCDKSCDCDCDCNKSCDCDCDKSCNHD